MNNRKLGIIASLGFLCTYMLISFFFGKNVGMPKRTFILSNGTMLHNLIDGQTGDVDSLLRSKHKIPRNTEDSREIFWFLGKEVFRWNKKTDRFFIVCNIFCVFFVVQKWSFAQTEPHLKKFDRPISRDGSILRCLCVIGWIFLPKTHAFLRMRTSINSWQVKWSIR